MSSRARTFADFSNQAGRKNALINGRFDIWQRGTSFANIGNNVYSTDRWLSGFSVTASRYNVVRSVDVPTVAQAGRVINFSALCTVNIADASIGASDANVPLQQRIEGFNFAPLAQQPMVLSFWVKSSLAGTYCVGLRNSIFDRSFVGEYTINLANTWEFKTIRVLPSPSAGTWNYTNGHGIDINFTLMAGTTFQTTPNIWQTGNFFATSNQVNHAAVGGNTFRVTNVQLETGNIATPFEVRSFGEELALCQRYFEKTYNTDTAPGTITGTGSVQSHTDESVGNVIHNNGWDFAVRKRATPTVIARSHTSSTPNRVNGSADGNLAVDTIGAGESRVTSITLVNPAPSSGSSQVWVSHFTVDAEL